MQWTSAATVVSNYLFAGVDYSTAAIRPRPSRFHRVAGFSASSSRGCRVTPAFMSMSLDQLNFPSVFHLFQIFGFLATAVYAFNTALALKRLRRGGAPSVGQTGDYTRARTTSRGEVESQPQLHWASESLPRSRPHWGGRRVWPALPGSSKFGANTPPHFRVSSSKTHLGLSVTVRGWLCGSLVTVSHGWRYISLRRHIFNLLKYISFALHYNLVIRWHWAQGLRTIF